MAWKPGSSSDRLKGRESITSQDFGDEDSQAGRFLTPVSCSSCISVSIHSRSLSPESGSQNVARDEAFSSEQTLHPKGHSTLALPLSPPSLECEDSTFPGARPSIGQSPRGNGFAPSVALSHDGKRGRPRGRGSHLQRLIEKRMAVLGVRLRVHESRNALRNIRETLIDMDARFSQELRMLVARSANAELEALLSQGKGIQNYREEVQLRESEYNVLEDELNLMEWEMKEEETKLYEQLSNASDHLPLDDVGYYSDGDAVYVASSSSAASASSYVSPSTQRWLSRVGDRNLLMEQLQELRAERAHWVEKESIRHRVGLSLDEEGQHFLDTFDSRHGSIKDDLVQVEADLARLQESLSEQADVLYSSSQFDEDGEILDRPSMESSLSMASASDADPASNDPLFLREDKPHPAFSNAAADSNQDSISTVSYINEWLLHILRRSAVEVRRFKTTEKIRTLQIDREQLARLVLEWWSKDETVDSFPRARNHTGRSVSLTSKANQTEYTRRRTRSDSVLFSVDRIARRLQGSQRLRFDGAPSPTAFRGSKVLDVSHHATAWSL